MDVGEKKLSKVIVPDKWKEGASNTQESGGRKINENKLLSKKKRFVLFNNLFSMSLSIKLTFSFQYLGLFFPSLIHVNPLVLCFSVNINPEL